MKINPETLEEKLIILAEEIPQSVSRDANSVMDYLKDHPQMLQDLSVIVGTPVPREGFELAEAKIRDLGERVYDYALKPSDTSLEERRGFFKDASLSLAKASFAGALLLALAKCAHSPPTAGRNPYFKGPGHEKWTFMRSIYDGWTPGISWVVSPNTPMVAVAPGEVIYAQPIRIPGHAGGLDLWVHHYGDVRGKALRDGSVIPGPPYESHYAHLNRLEKEIGCGKKVSRGQVLGYAGDFDTNNQAKLMLMEEGNLVNPDNYGPGHSFMNYWDGSLNLEINDIDDRIRKQRSLLQKLFESYLVNDKGKLFKKLHRKGYYGHCWWSLVEKFKYLESEYSQNLKEFNIAKEEFAKIKKEFYENQPIILTLPFKNPRKK